jgi:hypothetical protein
MGEKFYLSPSHVLYERSFNSFSVCQERKKERYCPLSLSRERVSIIMWPRIHVDRVSNIKSCGVVVWAISLKKSLLSNGI